MDGWAWLDPQEGKQREEKGMVWEETRGKVVLANVAGCQVAIAGFPGRSAKRPKG